MAVKFSEKFEEVLKEASNEFDIDWSLVEIKYVPYEPSFMSSLPMSLENYVVRMRVLELGGEIQIRNIDEWFKSHKFIYAIMSKYVETDFEDTDMITFDAATISSIATRIHDIFRGLHRQ